MGREKRKRERKVFFFYFFLFIYAGFREWHQGPHIIKKIYKEYL